LLESANQTRANEWDVDRFFVNEFCRDRDDSPAYTTRSLSREYAFFFLGLIILVTKRKLIAATASLLVHLLLEASVLLPLSRREEGVSAHDSLDSLD
jgi:hypothetical protein